MSKACSKCGVERPLTEFHKRRIGKYGRTSRCKYCRVADNARTNSVFCGGDTAYAGWNNARTRSPLTSLELRDGLSVREVVEETREIYELRDRLNAEAGHSHAWHVDHIIPLAEGGKHRAYNLRLLTGAENISRWHNEKGQDIDYVTEHMTYEQVLEYERVLMERMAN